MFTPEGFSRFESGAGDSGFERLDRWRLTAPHGGRRVETTEAAWGEGATSRGRFPGVGSGGYGRPCGNALPINAVGTPRRRGIDVQRESPIPTRWLRTE